jgi:hypothetical protein
MKTPETLVLPIWLGQVGPAMPLSAIDQWPVVILSQYATEEQIAAAKAAIASILDA